MQPLPVDHTPSTTSIAPTAPPVTIPPADDLSAFTLAYLLAHEAPCPVCGYNLHALLTPRCPECGNALTLRIVNPIIASGPWILAMVFASASAAIGLFFAIAIVHDGWRNTFRGPASEVLSTSVFLLSIPIPALLLLFRRFYLRRHRLLQYLGALLIAAASILAFSLFAMSIK
jgi:hypothetical protein